WNENLTFNELSPNICDIVWTFPIFFPCSQETETFCFIPDSNIRTFVRMDINTTDKPRKRELPIFICVCGKDEEDRSGLALHVLRPFCNVRWDLLRESVEGVSDVSDSNVDCNAYRRCTSSGSGLVFHCFAMFSHCCWSSGESEPQTSDKV